MKMLTAVRPRNFIAQSVVWQIFYHEHPVHIKLPHKLPHLQKNNRTPDFSDARNHCKMAEWERFELSQPCDSNDLANRPLQPLEYHSVAERVGFEPTVPCGITGFQDQLLKPLGHLSVG